MRKPSLPTRSRDTARKLRATMTDAEQELRRHPRAGQLDGLKFRRQHPVPPCFVDFHCDALKLVAGLDGSQHNPEVGAVRTRHLETQGLAVMRCWNNDVLNQTEAVIEAIFNFAGRRTLTPPPLPEGEGLKSDKP
ncbi:endonuclease domain-containing protein [Marilutibacter chinensis]|uniref:DUF559 domain-containing protein n=1 Tax=Marilutibacter chinensis TaxID=2912247 RepID=A0ABS9HSQ2_9GAMM|nr:DUF559 domain-containing protein [Lysobacter chinensis]MCF7221370.1 DUF559 domain-containing protein [Lysobacter chinensis]